MAFGERKRAGVLQYYQDERLCYYLDSMIGSAGQVGIEAPELTAQLVAMTGRFKPHGLDVALMPLASESA